MTTGIDYQFSGIPSKINTKKINSIHEKNDVVLLTPCAMSQSGESLNVNSECLAVSAATALGANKLIFCSDKAMILRNRSNGETIQNFRLRDAKTFLNYRTVKIHQDFFPSINQKGSLSPDALDMLLKIAWCSIALEKGVERAHIVAPTDGALLTELFTAKEGSATCISQDEVEEIHPDENFFGSDVTNGWIEPFGTTSGSGRWFD
jgi:amino-acid N-acetyltransferase